MFNTCPVIDETHDPRMQSWVSSASNPGSDFPVQNLPFGAFRPTDGDGTERVGVRIGDEILDLRLGVDAGLLDGLGTRVVDACGTRTLNALMACPPGERRALRQRLSRLLRVDSGSGESLASRDRVEACLQPVSAVEMGLPAAVGDYSDFYASIHHATNVGRMFRPDSPLLPNYRHVPVGYHGRASSLVPSLTPIRRPHGQFRSPDRDGPEFGPSRRLDFELEVGFFVTGGNPLGTPIPIEQAAGQIFGLCLVNDWSARDIQQWEYQPLGPFLGKSFATTISPWIVTVEALAPFRCPAVERGEGEPAPLRYLDDASDRARGGIDLTLDARLSTARMREAGVAPVIVSRSSLASLYWTPAQLVTHHASNGCNLRPGDLLASGTVSGPNPGERGCLLEITWGGQQPIQLPGGERRQFLEDGDEVTLAGFCERAGYRRIGLGECRGEVVRD